MNDNSMLHVTQLKQTQIRIFLTAVCLLLALTSAGRSDARTVEECLEFWWSWCWEFVAKGDLEVTAQCYLAHAAYCTPSGSGNVAPGSGSFTAGRTNRPLWAPPQRFNARPVPQYFPPVIPTHQYGNWLGANCRRVVNRLCCPCRLDRQGRYTGVCCHPIH